MKKILFALIALTYFSCDKIEGPTRDSISIDTTCSFDEDNSAPVKKVLVEDYTGFLCGNCPAGGIFLNDSLRPTYGDNMIVVSVHAGYFSIPCGISGGACPGTQPAGSFLTNYATTTGTDWDNFFGNSAAGNPNALINRIDYNTGQQVKYPASWSTAIQAQSVVAPEVRIRLKNIYDPATRNLKTCIESKFLNASTDNYKLQVVLTEDSIIDWQLWYSHSPDEFEENYIHRHLLRTSMNGSFGTVINNAPIASGETFVTGFNFVLDNGWNENHCNVVAFIYDAATYRVIQVEELEVE